MVGMSVAYRGPKNAPARNEQHFNQQQCGRAVLMSKVYVMPVVLHRETMMSHCSMINCGVALGIALIARFGVSLALSL
jgi:hypothetical protein